MAPYLTNGLQLHSIRILKKRSNIFLFLNYVMLFSATSKNCGDISEEATSESDGSFRFRGLKPKCNYVITFLSGESIEKIIPSQVEGKKYRVIVML